MNRSNDSELCIQTMNRNIHSAQHRPIVLYRFTQTVVCSFTAGSISEGLAGTLCKLSWVGHAGRMDTGSSGLDWLNSKSPSEFRLGQSSARRAQLDNDK